MATVKEKLQSEINRANAKTGASDTTVHNAISRLISGYGSSSGGVGNKTAKLSSNGTSISFTGLNGAPKNFSVIADGQWSQGTTRFVAAVHSDGTNTFGVYFYRYSTTGTAYYSSSYYTWTYSNGTLTINSTSSTNGGYFNSAINYRLIYSY